MSSSDTTPMGDPLVGAELAGRYRVERLLAEGGMGNVYAAVHIELERRVALKVLHAAVARQPDLAERFVLEARVSAGIVHPNVVEILDFGRAPDGRPFYAMELLEGRELAQELGWGCHPLPWIRARRVLLQICDALQAAHETGVVHRDLKPENVFLIERPGTPDFVKVFDFGIAKLERSVGRRHQTREGIAFGTPGYMAPEQARGERGDARSDVYSVGCILFEVVAGRPPFEGATILDLLREHQFAPVPTVVATDPGLAAAVDPVVQRALAKDPDGRFATMRELRGAIAAIPIQPAPGSPEPITRRRAGPRPTSPAVANGSSPSPSRSSRPSS